MTSAPGPGIPAALSIVTLGVSDLVVAQRFYDALGWRRRSSSVADVITWYDLGAAYLGLFPQGDLAADTGVPQATSGGFRDATYAINLPAARDVDEAVEVARRAGARVVLEPVTTDYGVRHACFLDPDGHAWELGWNPAFPVVEGRTTIP